jgi:hypothetical protein
VVIVLFVLAGFLLGGAWSMRRQGAGSSVVALLAVSGVLAGVAGLLRL